MEKKYPKSIVAIHWIHAALIMFLLLSGGLILSNMPNTAQKISSLKGHFILGLIAGVILLVRLYLVSKAPKLEPLKVTPFRQKLLKWNHRLIYIVLFIVVLSGMATAKISGVGEIVFFNLDKELYKDAPAIAQNIKLVHQISTKILMALIVMHVAGVISYTIKTKDNIIKRVWF